MTEWIRTGTFILSYLCRCELSMVFFYPLLSTLADPPWTVSFFLPIIAYIGFTAGYMSLSCTKLFTSLTINGSVSFGSQQRVFVQLTTFSCPSPNPLCITCFPPRGWISSISSISLVHIYLPPSPATLPGSISCGELLEYFCTSGTLAPLFFGAKMNTDMSGCPRFMTLI